MVILGERSRVTFSFENKCIIIVVRSKVKDYVN